MASEQVLPRDLLESGDPAFVDAIRQVDDADALAGIANDWFNDSRPGPRRLLLEYLDQPLNAFRHEGLVKRLFKQAEAAGDDAVMARFLVLFDRSTRRVRRRGRRWMQQVLTTEAEARALRAHWEDLGYLNVNHYTHRDRFYVHGIKADEYVVQPRKTMMPRGRMVEVQRWDYSKRALVTDQVPDWAVLLKLDWQGQLKKADLRELPWVLKRLEKYRLFSVATRNYLRRRSWRYFRKLGRTHPERYVSAVSEALTLYRDEDMADGLALIDNWGLVHILFHHSPALKAKTSGWITRPGHSLGELAPAPIFDGLWKEAPGAVVGLLTNARSQTVRRWAIRRIEADLALHQSCLTLEGWLALLGHDDPEVISLAAKMLDRMEGLESVGVDDWLALADSTPPAALDVVCELIRRFVRADQVTLGQAVRLAGLRPLPLARLGLSWVKQKQAASNDDLATFFSLVDAECEPLRPEILEMLGRVLATLGGLDSDYVLMFLDSRHADARLVGWNAFRAIERLRDDVEMWQKLLESPYDDVRLALVAELESRESEDSTNIGRTLGPEAIRTLWASVLLNVHRGGRAKPLVVRQLLRRLEAHPVDAPTLLPLLGVALRSVRGPERRAGLVAVVRLVEGRAEVEPLVRSSFPELHLA